MRWLTLIFAPWRDNARMRRELEARTEQVLQLRDELASLQASIAIRGGSPDSFWAFATRFRRRGWTHIYEVTDQELDWPDTFDPLEKSIIGWFRKAMKSNDDKAMREAMQAVKDHFGDHPQ